MQKVSFHLLIRRITTIMTPGETGGKENEINLSPEGA